MPIAEPSARRDVIQQNIHRHPLYSRTSLGSLIAGVASVMMRILKQPTGTLDGVSLAHYHVGKVYEVPASLGEYLVMEGYAIIEMRRAQRSRRYRPADRRRRA